ncbi:MAG: hypothetical protein MUF49_08410 [Oculatellaceae cyanobacterium Prado106]|nr:hypothetical protein [Oculatellaceae cyanobacterium Prado106]
MDNTFRAVTQLDLRAQGLSDYRIRLIVKNLNFSRRKTGLRIYDASDVITAIEGQLASEKISSDTRSSLLGVLVHLKGQSNVIRVDFLKNLSLEERAKALKTQIEAADADVIDVLGEYEEIKRKTQATLAGVSP